MYKFNGIMVISVIVYLLGVILFVIGKRGLKKTDKEFSKSNCDISEMEREKRLPYTISEMERKKRRPYFIYTLIGYPVLLIALIFIILAIFKIV